MSVNSLQATQAYQNITQALGQATQSNTANSAQSAINSPDGSSFSQLLNTALSETSANVQAAEIAGNQVITGDANLVDVVTSISAAEVSLEAAIAVRSRVIEAYQEIMRMPI